MKKLIYFLIIFTFCVTGTLSQSDRTAESQLNVSSSRKVTAGENTINVPDAVSRIPADLFKRYNDAVDSRNEPLKILYGRQMDEYLDIPYVKNEQPDIQVIKENIPPFSSDWYSSDVLVNNNDLAYTGSYRQIDLKQGEDGWMYMAINKRNAPGINGTIMIYKSGNGGASWTYVASTVSITGYFGSFAMLVESRNNNVPDSTRIIIYATLSSSANHNDAYLVCTSVRRDGSSSTYAAVAYPSAGNRFVSVSACSDGMFWSNGTIFHAVLREETNAGVYAKLHHFRTIDWGANHSFAALNTFNDERNPVCAFSNETGSDSIYIAVERYISANESEIRLIANVEVPVNTFTTRYITDASPGTVYKRPAISIQQRIFTLPQRILVTCTKNDKAVYHYSTDGGAAWNIDFGLGPNWMQVDYTSCSSDTLFAGGKDFIAAFVDLNGDSVTVRHGELGFLGTPQYRKNTYQSTGLLAPACAIYKDGSDKYSAFSYAGTGPSSVYYNMETLITGIEPVSGNTPQSFTLKQNYPNPFNPVTNIEFSLPEKSFVKLVVYDMLGKAVETLVNGSYSTGTYKVDWNAANLPSGVYFYKLETAGFTDVKKMILVK